MPTDVGQFSYRGCTVDVIPMRPEGGGWRPRCRVVCPGGTGASTVHDIEYTTIHFSTRELAAAFALEAARRWIDQEIG